MQAVRFNLEKKNDCEALSSFLSALRFDGSRYEIEQEKNSLIVDVNVIRVRL